MAKKFLLCFGIAGVFVLLLAFWGTNAALSFAGACNSIALVIALKRGRVGA